VACFPYYVLSCILVFERTLCVSGQGVLWRLRSFEIWDVGYPKVSSNGIKDSSGMSGKTLLSTTLLDAMMYSLH
jgi:hypothetical protein